MAIQEQMRRGTKAENDAFTGALGETTYDTDNDRQINHDGSTQGGIPNPNFKDVQSNYFTAVDAGGTANAITLTLPYAPTAYAEYQKFTFKPSANNTGAVTINVNGLGVKDLKKDGGDGALTALEADDLKANIPVDVIYDGTDFILQLGGGGGGRYVIITNESLSGGAYSITGLSATSAYHIELHGVRLTSGGTLLMTIEKGGSPPTAGSYTYGVGGADEAGTTSFTNSTSASNWPLTGGRSLGTSISGINSDLSADIWLSNPNASVLPHARWKTHYISTTSNRVAEMTGAGSVRDSGFTTGFDELIITPSSNFVAGQIVVSELVYA
jgi:hypothetical protein